jgi:hypothetical protein
MGNFQYFGDRSFSPCRDYSQSDFSELKKG